MSLTDAAQAMLGEIRALAAWESDLLDNLSETRARKAELIRSFEALIRVLSMTERRELRAEAARIQVPLMRAQRRASVMTDRIEAAHTYLATAEEAVTTAGLQKFLVEKGLVRAKDDAALILNRKVAQGMVERVRRGLYRTNPDHPVIARRRLQLAFQ
jgi:hypothetical protein